MGIKEKAMGFTRKGGQRRRPTDERLARGPQSRDALGSGH